jgi:GGDEF domain-containing protein
MGRAAGDQILAEIGRRLPAHLQQDDTITRHKTRETSGYFGWEEMNSGSAGRSRRSQRRHARGAENAGESGRSVSGIALSTPIHERSEDLLRDADEAMHARGGQTETGIGFACCDG